ncbi:hypothetical protein Fcan01_18893 [Folsomia candida]|uniref:Uncharacterized protein n=1 Tax=Folsomia candida TaxID=158441 RepID=A0A226DP37_FOLCA|nr:hypothetical protein Fcan01_18893 [Folsomia candida]
MISFLAFPVFEKLPQTFEQLMAWDYEVGFLKHGDSAYNTLKASTDKVYVKLLNEMEIITGNGLEYFRRSRPRSWLHLQGRFRPLDRLDASFSFRRFMGGERHVLQRPPSKARLEINQTDKLALSHTAGNDNLTLKHISDAFYTLAVCWANCAIVYFHEVISFHEKMTEKAGRSRRRFRNLRDQKLRIRLNHRF